MKLKYFFEATELDDELICVPVGPGSEEAQGVLKLNASGYEIVKLLEEDTSVSAIVDALAAKYQTERAQLANYVEKFVGALRESGMIEE
ncbi:MAG: PqqD family protein [Bacillota bacterium]|nr:PqqD family protein [Bacillota bacterium]